MLRALDGGYVPAGPSGAPTRGGAHVLPTGRNLYSVDPKALPSALRGRWAGPRRRAGGPARGRDRRHPTTVGLVLWGTAAMRTGGDDAAQALALLGVRPAGTATRVGSPGWSRCPWPSWAARGST